MFRSLWSLRSPAKPPFSTTGLGLKSLAFPVLKSWSTFWVRRTSPETASTWTSKSPSGRAEGSSTRHTRVPRFAGSITSFASLGPRVRATPIAEDAVAMACPFEIRAAGGLCTLALVASTTSPGEAPDGITDDRLAVQHRDARDALVEPVQRAPAGDLYRLGLLQLTRRGPRPAKLRVDFGRRGRGERRRDDDDREDGQRTRTAPRQVSTAAHARAFTSLPDPVRTAPRVPVRRAQTSTITGRIIGRRRSRS